LKAEREDMELDELFRDKLENAEVAPDPSFNARLMKKLARKEFMTFNPARLNVYYLSGAIIAGITAGVIFFSGNDNTVLPADKTNISEFSVKSDTLIVSSPETLPDEHITKEERENGTLNSASKSLAKTEKSISALTDKTEVVSQPAVADHQNVGKTLSKSSLLKENVIDPDKLVSSTKGNERGFVSSVTEGCKPLRVKFISRALDIDSCRWTFGDGGVSYAKTPEWIFDIEGEYKVVLEMFSAGKHVATSTNIIKVYPRPVANFEIGPEKAIIPDDEIRFINYSTDAVKYLWDFGDGSHSEIFEPQYRYARYGNYNVKLTVFNEYGCPDSILVQNAFSGSKYFIEFPNAFIPNTDGPSGGIYSQKSDESAQVFHPAFAGVTEYQLKIFSKMGILIFESNDINIGWDGYFKGQLSNSGVYIWKVRGKYRNGEPFTKMGDVTLLKN
jgi:PKD repeat protein